MPCHAAMSPKHPTVSPEEGADAALALLKKDRLEILPVVDEDDNLVGVFSIAIMLKNILPVSVSVGGALQGFSVKAAPGIAKRLKKTAVLKVSDLMERKVPVVNPETPTWEGVNALVENGGPLIVTEAGTDKYVGVITFQSALDELQRMKESDS